MAWRRPGDKPLSEPMMVSLLTHICVTRPQWVKSQASRVHRLTACSVYGMQWRTVSYVPTTNSSVHTIPPPLGRKGIVWALQWRHTGRDGASDHQPHDCLLKRLLKKKHQSSAPLACVKGIHRWPVNSPHKGPVTRKMFPFDDVIMSNICMCRNMSKNTLWHI